MTSLKITRYFLAKELLADEAVMATKMAAQSQILYYLWPNNDAWINV